MSKLSLALSSFSPDIGKIKAPEIPLSDPRCVANTTNEEAAATARRRGGPSIIFAAAAALRDPLTKSDEDVVHNLRTRCHLMIFLLPKVPIPFVLTLHLQVCTLFCEALSLSVPVTPLSCLLSSPKEEKRRRWRGRGGRTQKCFPDFD